MYAHEDFLFLFFFFFDLIPFFLFSLTSLPVLSPFIVFRMLGHLSRPSLVLTGLHYEGTTVNRTFLSETLSIFSYFGCHLRPNFLC